VANATIRVVKAGVITSEQSKSPMQLFSLGCVINSHVMGDQHPHFAPVMLKLQISDEEKLNQYVWLPNQAPLRKEIA
jgi:hypothetical protein